MFSLSALQSWALAALLVGLYVQAAPMTPVKRQVGDLQCNIDRVDIIADILAMQTTVSQLATQVTCDPTNAALVSAAQVGINQAETSVEHILEAVVAGQNASAVDRGGVETGLNAVLSALSNITSTDPNVTATVSIALGQLQNASIAGDGVLQDCT